MDRDAFGQSGGPNDPPSIRVLVVEDDPLAREAIRGLLESFSDGEIVVAGEASNGHEAVDLCSELLPDVVVMDLLMRGMDGFTAAELITASRPVKVIVLTGFPDDEFVSRALTAGVVGYLHKPLRGVQLVRAVRAAVDGQSILSPEAIGSLTRLVHPEPHQQARPHEGPPAPSGHAPVTGHEQSVAPPERPLTLRQGAVLALMMQGLRDGEIAKQLFISINTVRFHARNIFPKLGATNRTGAISNALRQSWRVDGDGDRT